MYSSRLKYWRSPDTINLEWYFFVRGWQDLANYLNYHSIHGYCVSKDERRLINDNNNVLQKMKRYFDIMDDDSEVLQYFKSIGIKIEELEKPKIATTSL